jgi:23S rRNA (guanosine2251-2'-O)-methyltransferase
MTKHKKSPKIKMAKYADKEAGQVSSQKKTWEGRNNSQLKQSGSGLGPNGQIWLYGIHVVEAALANPKRKKYRLLVNKEWTTSYKVDGNEIEPEYVTRQDIERQLPLDAVHQGLILLVAPLDHVAIETICRDAKDNSVVIVLDQVSDPRNIGAIMRSAIAFGASAIVVTDKYTPEATASLAKAASGALDRLPIVRVTNLTRSLVLLKKAGFWLAGLEANANQTIAQASLSGKLAIILGAEGSGLRRLTSENCDYLVKIPIEPSSDSLNVSVAASIALYEIFKSRP